MGNFKSFCGVLPLLLGLGCAANIFVSHYQGTVSSLNFVSAAGGTYSLTPNSTLTIGGQPSWLTWNSTTRTLYVSDETAYFAPGSITAVSAATNGGLSQLARATAVGGAVANVLYGNGNYIAIAH